MTHHLPEHEWLTPKQALKLLQRLEQGLTMADMASYCTELKLFSVYVRLRMSSGIIPDEQTEVYGLGAYAVKNPEDLFYSFDRVTLHLNGDVFNAPEPEALKLRDVDWEYTIQKNRLRIWFKRSELKQLFTLPPATDLTEQEAAPPAKTHLVVISMLLDMLKNGERMHTQTAIAEAIEAEFPHVHGLGETSLRTLFAAANTERENAPERSLEPGRKIRLDKI